VITLKYKRIVIAVIIFLFLVIFYKLTTSWQSMTLNSTSAMKSEVLGIVFMGFCEDHFFT